MFKGAYTALITPMLNDNDKSVDFEGLHRLIEFQFHEGINGVLAVGTTGESPTLNWGEHLTVVKKSRDYSKGLVIAGTGSNSTDEAIHATKEVSDLGVKHVLLVDPYYNGPSSLEIRLEYIEPIARKFPDVNIIPYVIPGRTGTQLLPLDLSILHKNFSNVCAVKEATGSIDNMILTRRLCGDNFDILSGDDDKTVEMMARPDINASGVISVVSNVAPHAVKELVDALLANDSSKASALEKYLKPLFSVVTVKTDLGNYVCKSRNPVPYKTLMNILGMPSGPSRQPLGRMNGKCFNVVLNTARQVYENSPRILEPVEKFFDVDLSKRLYNTDFSNLFY